MTFRSLRIAILCTAAAGGTALLAAPAAAQSDSKPMKLQSFMKKPIASAATRAVKKRDGSYRQVSLAGRSKPAAPPAAPASPAVMRPDAAAAFASHAASLVRVVSPGELNEIDLAADAIPVSTTAVEDVAAPTVQTAEAEQLNVIDRAADTARAVSLDELNRTLAAPVVASEPDKTDEPSSWLQRMLIMVGGAFAAASAAVRFLVG